MFPFFGKSRAAGASGGLPRAESISYPSDDLGSLERPMSFEAIANDPIVLEAQRVLFRSGMMLLLDDTNLGMNVALAPEGFLTHHTYLARHDGVERAEVRVTPGISQKAQMELVGEGREFLARLRRFTESGGLATKDSSGVIVLPASV